MPLPPDLTRCRLTANAVVFEDVAKNSGIVGVPYLIRRVREINVFSFCQGGTDLEVHGLQPRTEPSLGESLSGREVC